LPQPQLSRSVSTGSTIAARRADNDPSAEPLTRSIPCLGLNGGPEFPHTEALSFQIATDTQEEADRYWNAIVRNGGEESQCGWCKDRWGLSWQITPRVLTNALAAGGAEARRDHRSSAARIVAVPGHTDRAARSSAPPGANYFICALRF